MTPERQIHEAFAHVHEVWTPRRLTEGRVHLEKKRVRRQVTRATLAMGAGAALAVVVASYVPFGSSQGHHYVSAPEESSTARSSQVGELTDGALLLSDGSFAAPLSPSTALAVEADASDHVRIALLEGAARFDVVRNPERAFVVGVRGLRVEVIGTRFDVELEGSRCHVRVARGHVRVTWARGRRDLFTGQSGLFPLEDGGIAPPSDDDVASVAAPVTSDAAMPDDDDDPHRVAAPRVERTEPSPRTEAVSPGDWRQLARAGDYESAFRASREQSVGSNIDDLWLAADASRLSGHPREAVAYLEAALHQHPNDARVHLAAFTLGRLRLQLGRARQAAQDFAMVERLDRRGVLVEQALAREVEAWARAGDTAKARERAAVYLRRFPRGTYAERVRRFSTPP